MKKLEDYVLTIPNFPSEGVMFRDITSVIRDADGLQLAVDAMADVVEKAECDAIVGLESRGFIFGMPVAYKLHKPFILVRKQGKLPRKTISESYALEYGESVLEMQVDDLKPGSKVVVIDDLIATGGSIGAGVRLVEKVGCTVSKIVVLMELKGLNGRAALSGYDLESIISYEGK